MFVGFFFFPFAFYVTSSNKRQKCTSVPVPVERPLLCLFSSILIVPSAVTVIQVLGPLRADFTDQSGKALNWKNYYN